MEWKRRSAYVLIKARPGMAEQVFNKLKDWDHTIGTFMTHWPWDLMVWFDAENIEETHKWVAEIRDWSEVEWTSTQHVFLGYKRDYWFWERPAGAWVKIRSKNMYETYEDLKNYEWMCTFSSVPGDWDCIGYLCGDSWEEIFGWLGDLKNRGYELECYTPYRTWWNRAWENKWFEEEKALSSAT
ncbi:MAG: hypothetical protein ACYTG7_01510 [Planctomycetota bacterium]|jgi:hypothetical protein